MIRKDYIQRYFDELAKVLAAVLQLKDNQKPVEAESKISDFAKDYLGLSLEEILKIDPKNFINTLIKEREFTITHFKILEDLLYHKFLLNSSNDNLKSLNLELLNYNTENDKDYSVERSNRLKELSQ